MSSNIVSGSKVQIIKKGEGVFWNSDMMLRIGDSKTYTIGDIDYYSGIQVATLVEEMEDYIYPISSFRLLSREDGIEVVYRVGSMDFNTLESAKDHLLRKRISEFFKDAVGENSFVNKIVNNKDELIKLLKG